MRAVLSIVDEPGYDKAVTYQLYNDLILFIQDWLTDNNIHDNEESL